MNNEELIDGLRWCADESICCDDFSGEKCPYFDEKKSSCSVDEILHAAADALEAAGKRIAELEAQLPKDGEWLRTDAFPHRVYCSCCYKTYVPNENWQIWQDDADNFGLPRNYCPNCGAKMKKGEQE